MNNKEEYKEDLLMQYITSERIAKAPKGFTSKVMTRVRLETLPSMVVEKSWKKNLIPVISASVTVLLIASAILIPGSQSDSMAKPILSLIKNLKFSIPDINVSSIFRFSLPSVMLYVIVGILILTLFDRALHQIFYREK
ncbi:MAG: hypothetical protein WA816_13770 [Bacteroidales bacterium]